MPNFGEITPKVMADDRHRRRWHPSKRRRAQVVPTNGAVEQEDLSSFLRDALTLQRGPLTFNMDSSDARAALARAVWTPIDLLREGSSSHANVELTAILRVLLQNNYTTNNDASEHRTALRVEGILANLQRAQSQKQMLLLTARLSCAAARINLPESMWRAINLFAPGLLASKEWTEDFIDFARKFRPDCPYDVLPGVGAVMFDNYSRRVLYSSQATVESHGFLLNMTNSATFHVPALLAPPNFDASHLCIAWSCVV